MTTLNLSQQLRLGLKLTPQQVQYLKLLQLPNLASNSASRLSSKSIRCWKWKKILSRPLRKIPRR